MTFFCILPYHFEKMKQKHKTFYPREDAKNGSIVEKNVFMSLLSEHRTQESSSPVLFRSLLFFPSPKRGEKRRKVEKKRRRG